jgi:predicted Zn-dependent protease
VRLRADMLRESVEIHRRAGRLEEADSLIRALIRDRPDDLEVVVLAGSVAAAMGQTAVLDSIRETLAHWSAPYTFGLPYFGLARYAALDGDADAAADLLRRALARGFYLGRRVHQEPDFAAVRGDSVFEVVAEPWKYSSTVDADPPADESSAGRPRPTEADR